MSGSFRKLVLLVTALLVILGVAGSYAPAQTPAGTQEAHDKHEEGDVENEAKASHEAERYWALRRGDLTPAVLASARVQAAALPVVQQLPASLQRSTTTATTTVNNVPAGGTIRLPPGGSWQALGPSPISVPGSAAHYAGRVSALTIDPTTSGSNTMLYAGAANGGVWKSTNNGASWTPLTDNQNSLAVGAITIDPNAHNVIYVGTGEPNQSLDSYFGVGVLKSTDGGSTWMQYGFTTFGNRSSSISRIIVNPLNSAQVFVASTIGLFVSNDGGQTYNQVGSGLPTANKPTVDALEIDASVNPVRLYATVRGQGFYRSLDGGASWARVGSILPSAGSWFRSALAVAPSSPNVLYLVITSDDYYGDVVTPQGYNGGYFSIDYGASWSQLTGLNVNFTNGGFGAQGWYDLALAVDPRNYNVVYGLGVDMAITTGGTTGAGWSNITSVYGIAGSNNSGIHPDQHAIAFGNCTLAMCGVYIGNDGGMYYSGNTTAPRDFVTYSNLNTPGFAIAEFTGGDISPNYAHQPFAVGGTQDNGSLLYVTNPQWQTVFGGDGGFAQIDWSQPDTMYITNFDISLSKSTDHGYSFSNASEGLSGDSLFYMPYQIDRSNGRHLVAGTSAVFETINGAANWYQSSPPICRRGASNCTLTSNAVSISAVTVAPTNSAIIYAGTKDGQLFKATNGGTGQLASYAHVNDAVFANKYINQITVDSLNPNVVYVAAGHYFYNSGSGYVFRSTDGGASWMDISGALPVIPVNSLVTYYTTSSRVIVIGTDLGAFFTTDEGTNWARLGIGLPNTAVTQLALDAQRSAIIAYTHGRSAWAIPIPAAYVTTSPGIGIYRPSTRTFYLRYGLSTGWADLTISLPSEPSTDMPLAGDWNGDGYDTIGLFRDGLFLLWDDNGGKVTPDYVFALGNPGDKPLAGDWIGRGRTGVGVFRPSNGIVYLKNNLSAGAPDYAMVYGNPGNIPLAGDWDGDGKDSIGVYQPPTGLFHLTNQSCYSCIPLANYVVVYGNPGWSIFSGDWTNSGRSGLGVFNPATTHIYLRNDPTTTGYSDIDFYYGAPGDQPIAGRWLRGAQPTSLLNPPAILGPNNTAPPLTTIPAPATAVPNPGGLD